jgi:phospholipid/cholesterol/gamma-HCH transport system substrate-binding protein
MNKGKLSPEAKVGLFVFLALILLFYMSFRVGEFKFGKAKGYPIITYFKSVEGLKKDSGVQIAGVQVGKVQEIALEGNRAKVTLRIRPDIVIQKDARAVIKTHGVLGEKYIEIIPGSPGVEALKAGQEIEKTVSAPDIDQLLTFLGGIAEDFQSVSTSLKNALGGPERERVISKTLDNIHEGTEGLKRLIQENEGRIKTILSNFDRFSMDMRGITGETQKVIGNLNRIVAKVDQGQGTIGKLITDETLYREATGVFQEFKTTFSDAKVTLAQVRAAINEAKGALSSINRMAHKVERGEGSLGKFVNEEDLYRDVRKGIDELKGTIADARKVIGSLERIASKIEKGEGTLGRFISDESLYHQAKKTLKSVDKAAEGLQDQVPITVMGVVAGTVLR